MLSFARGIIDAPPAIRILTGVAMALMLAATLAGCGSSAAHFTTELDSTGALANGSAVTHAGTPIGSVTGIGWMLNGDSKVSFDVGNGYSDVIHTDSIAVLQNSAGASSLNIHNPNPMSPIAASGSRIAGASSQRELAALMATRGLVGFASSLSGMIGALNVASSGAGSPPSPAGSGSASAPSSPPVGSAAAPPTGSTGAGSPSSGSAVPSSPSAGLPALTELQRELAALQRQAAASGSAANAANAATARQLQTITQQLQQLEQELIKQGNSAQAQKLRDELNRMARTLSTPPAAAPAPAPSPTPGSSGTLSTPRVY
ncbi:MAG: MlaD family protein [Candidatus Binataceae bacterium]